MRLADVKVGKRYEAKISGNLTTVRVTCELPGRVRGRFGCVNEATDRTCFCSAAKLRREIPEQLIPTSSPEWGIRK